MTRRCFSKVFGGLFYGSFWYFVPGFYVRGGVLWSAQPPNGGQRTMIAIFMMPGFVQFLPDLVKTWTVCGDGRRGRGEAIGNRKCPLWVEHCPDMVFGYHIVFVLGSTYSGGGFGCNGHQMGLVREL